MKLISKENVYDYIVILLILILPFSKALPNILLGILSVLLLIKIYKKEFIFYSKKHLFLFIILFSYLLIKTLIFDNFIQDIHYLSKYLLIILATLVFWQITCNKLILSFLLSIKIAVIVATFRILFYYWNEGEWPLNKGEIINEILIIERPYFGFCCLIGTILCLYLTKLYPKFKWLFFTLIIIFIAFIFLLAARLAIISLIIISSIYIFFYSNLSKFKRVYIIGFIFLILSLSIVGFKNLSKRFLTNTDKLEIYDPRVIIWGCTTEIVKDEDYNFIYGAVGYKWIENKFIECYSHKNNDDLERKQWFINQGFNSHNQFLDIYLIGGIIGLLIFIFFIGNLILISKNNFITFATIISLFLFFIVENILHRQFGSYLVAFVLTFVSRKNRR